MGFKDLFFVSEDENKEEKRESITFPETPTNKFPEETTGFPTETESAAPVVSTPKPSVPTQCAPHMGDVMKLYEDGFMGLNKDGIEFFEFFEAVVDGGMENPGAYKMALKMLKGMESSMTKESLLAQSQYYIDELKKVHQHYSGAGETKKTELIAESKMEEQTLRDDVRQLEDQQKAITSQIQNKNLALNEIAGKFQPQLNDLDCKIMANDEAKNRILGTIESVVEGIKKNL